MCEAVLKAMKAVNLNKLNVLSCAAKAIGKQYPTILRQVREQFFANSNNSHPIEMTDQIFDERSGMGRMTDRCWHNEREASSLAQESSSGHKKWCPRTCQARERDAETSAKAQRPLPRLPGETLVANKWRVACGAVEPFICRLSPLKEVTTMNFRIWRAFTRFSGGGHIAFYADTVDMKRDEAPVATGRVEQSVLWRANGEAHKGLGDGQRRVIRTVLLRCR